MMRLLILIACCLVCFFGRSQFDRESVRFAGKYLAYPGFQPDSCNCRVYALIYGSECKIRITPEALMYDFNDTCFSLPEFKSRALLSGILAETKYSDLSSAALNRYAVDCRLLFICRDSSDEKLIAIGSNNLISINDKVYTFSKFQVKKVLKDIPEFRRLFNFTADTTYPQVNFEQKALNYFFANKRVFGMSDKDTVVVNTVAKGSFEKDIFLLNSAWHKDGIVVPGSYSKKDSILNALRTASYQLTLPETCYCITDQKRADIHSVAVFRRFYYGGFVYVHLQLAAEVEPGSDALNIRAVLLKYNWDGSLLETLPSSGIVN